MHASALLFLPANAPLHFFQIFQIFLYYVLETDKYFFFHAAKIMCAPKRVFTHTSAPTSLKFSKHLFAHKLLQPNTNSFTIFLYQTVSHGFNLVQSALSYLIFHVKPVTGRSLSEFLILASTNPKYDKKIWKSKQKQKNNLCTQHVLSL